MALVDVHGKKIAEKEAVSTEKVEAEALEAKKKAFVEDPGRFLDISEVVVCVIRKPGQGIGLATFVGKATEEEYKNAVSGLVQAVGRVLAALKAQHPILRPNRPRIRDMFRRK